MKKLFSLLIVMTLVLGCMAGVFAEEAKKYTVTEMKKDKWIKVEQEGGPTLGYSDKSGVTILEIDGYAFKDLDKDGELDPYEDWRLTPQERAKDLAYKIHTDLGDKFIRAVNARTKRTVGADYELQDGDVIRIVANK